MRSAAPRQVVIHVPAAMGCEVRRGRRLEDGRCAQAVLGRLRGGFKGGALTRCASRQPYPATAAPHWLGAKGLLDPLAGSVDYPIPPGTGTSTARLYKLKLTDPGMSKDRSRGNSRFRKELQPGAPSTA